LTDLRLKVLTEVGAKHNLTALAFTPPTVSVLAKGSDHTVAPVFTDMGYLLDLCVSIISSVSLDLAAYRGQRQCQLTCDKTQAHPMIQMLLDCAALLEVKMAVVHLFWHCSSYPFCLLFDLQVACLPKR
jgi:hypothetical protein